MGITSEYFLCTQIVMCIVTPSLQDMCPSSDEQLVVHRPCFLSKSP